MLKNPGTKVIAFKLGWNEMEKAKELIGSGVSLVAVNTPESMGGETGSYTLVTSGGESSVEGKKEEIAAAIWKEIGKL